MSQLQYVYRTVELTQGTAEICFIVTPGHVSFDQMTISTHFLIKDEETAKALVNIDEMANDILHHEGSE